MICKSLNFKLFCFLLLFPFLQVHAEGDIKVGKALFKANCAQCHNKNMKDDLTGPALGGVQERWEGRDEVLYSWIRNSQAVIASGDEYAVNLYNKWNKSVMNPFTNLKDDEIASILAYVSCMDDGSCAPQKVATTGGGDNTAAGAGGAVNNNMLYMVLALILGLLALILARTIANLNYLKLVKEGNAPASRGTLADILTSKGVIGFLVFSLIVFAGYTTVNNAVDLNRQQGYAPEQPINFSHATHAGIQKIDCQYCHDGARRSKHSVIPAANTCMNCHVAIEKGSKFGTAEITKIYASVGYDPNSKTYIEDIENVKSDSIKAVYTKWIETQYRKTNSIEEGTELKKSAQRVITAEWDGIVSSLTNDLKKELYGPIPWVRIHNLPDHAYFSHAQHVSIGEVECQTCHGPVEKMDLVYQYSPLSMGWCINCHRETEVKFDGNEYYESYENFHKEIKDKTREGVTVEEIGGLECQKCHY